MSRTDTAVRVNSASPDRVFAALTDSDALAVWLPPRRMTGRFEQNAERRLPRSTVLVATATIRVVATEGQIYGRQLQQAGDYTGPHRDPHTATREEEKAAFAGSS
jgi:hypothetical protein